MKGSDTVSSTLAEIDFPSLLKMRSSRASEGIRITAPDLHVHEDVWWRGAIEDREFGPDEIGIATIGAEVTASIQWRSMERHTLRVS